MRTFVRLRRLFAAPGELVAQLQKLAETVQLHDDQIITITEVLRQMMEPPPTDRRIGFHPPTPPAPPEARHARAGAREDQRRGNESGKRAGIR